MTDTEILTMILNWFKRQKASVWVLSFGIIHILFLAIYIWLYAFGIDIVENKEAIGGIAFFAITPTVLGIALRDFGK